MPRAYQQWRMAIPAFRQRFHGPFLKPEASELMSPRQYNALAAGLTLLFLVAWLAPPLGPLQGVVLMPLWLHTLMEWFSIAIAAMIFGVVWNAHARERSSNIVILACAFLASGLIDIAHTLSYRGMPDFITPADPEKGINFWLAARLVMALALVGVGWRDWKPFVSANAPRHILAAALAVTGVVLWLGLFHQDEWPRTYIEGEGLTPFKVWAEYLIVLLLAIAALLFHLRRAQIPEGRALLLATLVTILSELCFTLYADVADLTNILGHVYKIVAYYFFYRAVFVYCVREPFQRLHGEVAERRAAERALAESARYQEELLAHLPAAVVVHDPAGTVRYCNGEAQRLLGVDAEAIRGMAIDAAGWRFLDEAGVPIDAARYPASRVLASREPLHDLVGGIVRGEDAPPVWVQVSAFPHFDAEGNVKSVVTTFIDISARREAELALRQLNEQLEQRVRQRTRDLEIANKELEAFSYSVSHDLRAPLRSIDGFSQVLLQRYTDKLDDAGRDYLGRVRRASQRMGELIDDLLQLSRLTRGTLRRQETDLSELATMLVQELRKSAPERAVAVAIQPGMKAHGDPGLLRALLDNLLGNAWKFTRHAEHAAIAFGNETCDGELVYFVRDNGAGFDNAYAHKLFRVFQRLHGGDEYEGTGIGLATVSRIVQRHHGRVWATGEPNKGATFYFTLPQRGADRDEGATNMEEDRDE
jgi:signal transduction histidine kinase